ncbi:DEAD/DEAH box helicase [Paenibacillus agricola]|uniref:DEAD/DEAH box helicase n=1 Tax=Paenibacillus agricola TaxID=2716264 RepID=A0ABX0J7K4_9BACL|nr:DEAD/DEAH box helicase [Paenibacillus agricola]NHN31791.1 DEAD/DEAH box helicase [Paenibacillus agricola]
MGTDPLQKMNPILAEWFWETFREPTDVQVQAWASIEQNRHTLIAAPTGSGKTLAAILPSLNRIIEAKLEGAGVSGRDTKVSRSSDSADGVSIADEVNVADGVNLSENGSSGYNEKPANKAGVKLLYITPLKALNNDIHHHVVSFSAELDKLAARTELDWLSLKVAVRSGDTPQKVRASILRKPPDILVTTPETLYLMLTSLKAREILRSVEQVVVDEIHYIAGDKRGAHLSLSLERLEALCDRPFLRIGVSATQKPLERVAAFLGGWEGGWLRPVSIIESHGNKKFDLRVAVLDHESAQGKDKDKVWIAMMDRILKEMEGCRSTLIFVNNRRLCERLAQQLNDYCGGDFASSHHGSISKEKRLEVESRLKSGELKCLIATSSLELGIDVGQIDLVIQVDSPLQATTGIQRIGRAGHSVGEVSRGVIIIRSRSSLPEVAVLSKMIREREIEPIVIRRNRIDVLNQQIVAMVAADDWTVGGLFELINGSDCYHTLTLDKFEGLLQVLSGFYPFVRPLIDWDRDTGRLSGRSSSRMAAIMGTGTIPGSANYPVYHIDSQTQLGELDEEYVHESRVGELFQLGAHSWTIREIRNDRVIVSEATNRISEIPFWRSEGVGRSFQLGEQVGAFLAELSMRLEDKQGDVETVDWLDELYGFDALAADSLMQLVRKQQVVSAVPTDRSIVIEQYQDVMNQTHVVLHNVWGRRLNRTWQILLEHHIEQKLQYRPYMCAKDNGIEMIFREWDGQWLQSIWQVASAGVDSILMESLGRSPMFAITFRRMAEVGLLLSRQFTRTPMWQKRLRSEELLKEVLPYAEQFPFFGAAITECFEEHLDAEGLKYVLGGIEAGSIQVQITQSAFPSAWATQFMWDYVNTQIYESDMLSSELQMQVMNINRELAGAVFGASAVGVAFEPEVLGAEKQRLVGAPGSSDELAVLLKRRGDLTGAELEEAGGLQALDWIRQLEKQGIAARLQLGGEQRWISRDEQATYKQFPHDPVAVTFVLNRYIDGRLTFSEAELLARYPQLSREQAAGLIAKWQQERRIEPAPWAAEPIAEPDAADPAAPLTAQPSAKSAAKPAGPPAGPLWSASKVCDRITRLSLQHFRNAGEPVDPARLGLLLLQRHHLLPGGHRAKGIDSLRHIMQLLQGIFLPYSQWEKLIFPSRIEGYQKADLDVLCASGEVLWIGRKETAAEKEGKIAFFLAESVALYHPFLPTLSTAEETQHPELLALLRAKGASFLTRLSADTGLIPSELLSKLFDLVWEGHISNDQWTPLRNYSAAKGKLNPKMGSGLGRWYPIESLGVPAVSLEESAVAWVRHLLQNHGIITKEVVSQYAPFLWETMVKVLKRLEELGTLTRGLFVRGITSMQFMERDVVDMIRKVDPLPAPVVGEAGQSKQTQQAEQAVAIHAADPADLFGTVLPWPEVEGIHFTRKQGNFLVYDRGMWVCWIENYGRKIVFLKDDYNKDPDMLIPIFRQMLDYGKSRKIVIDSWNGQQAADTAEGQMLLKRGAERDRNSLIFWPSTLG